MEVLLFDNEDDGKIILNQVKSNIISAFRDVIEHQLDAWCIMIVHDLVDQSGRTTFNVPYSETCSLLSKSFRVTFRFEPKDYTSGSILKYLNEVLLAIIENIKDEVFGLEFTTTQFESILNGGIYCSSNITVSEVIRN